jgi:ABC-type multidrug transport system ATPase subunit
MQVHENPIATDVRKNTGEPITPEVPKTPASVWSAKDAQYDQGYEEDRVITEGSALGQFFGTVKKNIVLKFRDPCNLLLEIFIPVVFIVGIMALWLAIPNTDSVGENLLDTNTFIPGAFINESQVCMNYTGSQVPTNAAALRFKPCNFATFNPAVGECLALSDSKVCVTNRTHMNGLMSFWIYKWDNAKDIPDLDQMILLMMFGKSWIDPKLQEIYNSIFRGISLYGLVHFAGPDATVLQEFRWFLGNTSQLFPLVAGLDFPNGAAANAHTTGIAAEGLNWGIIEFLEFTDTAFNVALHFNRSAIPWTNRVVNRFDSGGLGDEDYRKYYGCGWLTWQMLVNNFYYSYTNRVAPATPAAAPMPFVAWTDTAFLSGAGTLVPLLIVFSFLYPVSQQTKRLVEEKEKRIREAMLIMGLGSGSFYLSHWLTYQLIYLTTSLFASIILKLTVFNQSDFFITFFLYYLFCLSCISLSSLMSACFSKSRLATLLSPVIFFIISIPFFAVNSAPTSLLSFFSLMSPSGFAIGVDLLAKYESGIGMTSADLVSVEDEFNMATVFFFLIFDTIWYFLLALYLDNILPSEWGTQEHCCFCFIRCASAVKAADGEENDGRDPNGQYEPEPRGKPSVQLKGLRKEFTRGTEKFIAVNDLTMNLYEGQISVILGHNGAGKTTAINLMTGMLAPDGGDCVVYGKSVRGNIRGVRQEIGFCPQHNILWEDMTCREHLEYFAQLKGLTGEEKEDAVMEMIRAVDLEPKLNQPAGSLSGGMKRKLSVAIAFVGRSRVVFLDEPTAGMDVAARRHTWDLIKRMSPGRTIVLTTHYMDEADLLGNQIAIMSKGKLKCKGSSLFLKSRLGVGYTLSCAIEAAADVEAIANVVTEAVPNAEVLSQVAGEISFQLPMGDVPAFPDMLEALEGASTAIGLKSFGISVTTIEEVFLKVGHDEEVAEVESKKKDIEDNEGATVVEVLDADAWNTHRSQPSGFARQFTTLFAKRFANAKRDTRTQVFQIWLPIACLLLAMALSLAGPPDTPNLDLSPSMYKVPVQSAYSDCGANFTAETTSDLFDPAVVLAEDLQQTNATEFSIALQASYKKHPHKRMTSFFCANSTMNWKPFTLHNTSGRHAAPESIQQYYRTHLKATYGTAIESRIWTAPLMMTPRESAYFDSFSTLIVGIFILIPFTFIPSTFVSFVVKERECKAKHAQLISGMSPFVYWVSNFCFDIICFLGTNMLAIIVFLIFQRTEYIGGGEEFGGMFLLLLFYAASGITGAYFCSFAFDNHASAQNVVMLGNFIAGFLLVIAVWFFNFFPATEDAGKILPFFARIVPSYCLGEGIINMATRDLQGALGTKPDVFDMDVIGWNIVYMAIEFPMFLCFALLLDHPARQMKAQKLFHKPDQKPAPIEDEDVNVMNERTEVESGARNDDLVIVKNLCKVYPGPEGDKTAVKNLSFAVKAGEVFGFLGTNGAGKTTTMSILCGEQLPTHGRGFVGGFDVVDNAAEARRVVGYCPQFDSTMDLLNAEEHLHLYAGLRGIEPSKVDDVVNSLIVKAGLIPHRKTLAMNMSGGNRRKLSVAISLIGAPAVVILDEPSAGMDPMARRGLWEVIQAVAAKCAVVLTTHHLEEVEALSNRVAIMVDGSMRCIGSLQDLKHQYGSGFEMSIRVESEGRCAAMRKFMEENIPDAKEEEFRQQKFTFALPSDTKLSQSFRLVEHAKESLGVTDYSISQTSLEQVFLRIGADAEEVPQQE